jgi:hypothetical protein
MRLCGVRRFDRVQGDGGELSTAGLHKQRGKRRRQRVVMDGVATVPHCRQVLLHALHLLIEHSAPKEPAGEMRRVKTRTEQVVTGHHAESRSDGQNVGTEHAGRVGNVHPRGPTPGSPRGPLRLHAMQDDALHFTPSARM